MNPIHAALAALVLFQSGMTFRDRAGNVSISAADGFADRANNKLVLKGKVVAAQKDQGLEIRADELEATVTDPGKKSDIKDATAKGNVVLSKTTKGPAGSQNLKVQSSRAIYTAGTTESKLDLTGPVTIRSFRTARSETLVANAQRGTATLDPGATSTGPSAIRHAELEGNVKVTIDAIEPDGTVSKLVATGGRLIVDEAGTTPTLTLLEHVNVNGQGGYGIKVNDANRVTMKLNAKGEVVSFRTERGK